jgi:hypothetical protein
MPQDFFGVWQPIKVLMPTAFGTGWRMPIVRQE